MTINLPPELESSIRAVVQDGQFPSIDAAITEAARMLLRELGERPPKSPQAGEIDIDPVLGCLRDDAELVDEIVADIYRKRREETWRELDL